MRSIEPFGCEDVLYMNLYDWIAEWKGSRDDGDEREDAGAPDDTDGQREARAA